MKLRLERFGFTPRSTLGRLFIDDQPKPFCFTLEDVDRNMSQDMPLDILEHLKVKGETAIPYGEYKLVMDFSNRFGKVMPHILDVPAFTGIRIHAGNTDKDTEGCVLVGKTPGMDFIGQSRLAYDELHELILSPCTISVIHA